MFGVFTFTLTHFLAKTIFPEGMRGVHFISGNSRGVGGGGYFSDQKMEIPGRRGGAYVKFSPWWGYGYFLELHIRIFWYFIFYALCTYCNTPMKACFCRNVSMNFKSLSFI